MEPAQQIVAARASDLLTKQFSETPSYISPMLLTKGGTLLLGGEAKVGKSFLMLEAIRALTNGKPFMGNPEFEVHEPVKCLYIEAENGERSCQDRVKKIFEKEDEKIWGDRFWYVSKNLDLQLDTTRGVNNFKALVRDTQPQVLVLDPISFMYHREENSATEIGALFYTLGRLKEYSPDMALIFSHHFGKRPWGQAAQGYDPLSEYNFRGSSKWKDGGDTLITMQRFKEHARVFGECWEFKVRFLTRHGSSPLDSRYIFNDEGDLRIKPVHIPKKVVMPPLKSLHLDEMVQDPLDFAPAMKDNVVSAGDANGRR